MTFRAAIQLTVCCVFIIIIVRPFLTSKTLGQFSFPHPRGLASQLPPAQLQYLFAVVLQQYQEDKQRVTLLSCTGCCYWGDIPFTKHLWYLFPISVQCFALIFWLPPDPVALISSGFGTCCFHSSVAPSAAMSPANTAGQCQIDLIHQSNNLLRTHEEANCL